MVLETDHTNRKIEGWIVPLLLAGWANRGLVDLVSPPGKQ